MVAAEQVVEQGGPGAADMQQAGRARGETGADGHGGVSSTGARARRKSAKHACRSGGAVQQAVVIGATGAERRVGDRLRAWADAERGRFAPWLPVCMGAGVVLYFSLRTEPRSGWAAAVVCAAWRSRCSRGGARPAAGGAGAACGGARVPLGAARDVAGAAGARLAAQGGGHDGAPCARSTCCRTGGGSCWTTCAGRRRGAARPRLRVRHEARDATPVEAGRRVQVRAVMRAPAPPAYPGAWDMQRDAYLRRAWRRRTALNPVSPAAGHVRPPALRRGDPGGSRRDRASGHGGGSGPPGAIAATFLTGTTLAHPAGGPGGVPRFRPGAPAGGGRAAYRHRHGSVVRRDTAAARRAGSTRAALADQADRGVDGAAGGGRLHADGRRARAGDAQLRHGVPAHAGPGRRPAGALAARARACGAAPDGVRAAGGGRRQLPDELRRGARAHRRLPGAAAGADPAAWRGVVARHVGAYRRADTDQPAGGHRVGAVRGVPFRPHPALLHRRQSPRGAADGDVGDAVRAARRWR